MGPIAAAPALTPTTPLEHLQTQKPDQHRKVLHGPTPELMPQRFDRLALWFLVG